MTRLSLFIVSLVLGSTVGFAQAPDAGIRIDVPADGHVRVENQFGGVSAEIWREKFVLVSAAIDADARFRRSPVVIENRNKLLSVSIVRTPVDPPVSVQLSIKIPSSLHAELITKEGTIVLNGLPATASLRSSSGDVRASLIHPIDVEISARSATGAIRSELDSPLTEGGRVLRARLGSGERTLRIDTDSGEISLQQSGAMANGSSADASAPVLYGARTVSPAVGVPATAGEEEVDEGDVIRVDSQLVTLNMSVVDRNTSRGILGLDQSDFRLFEDGAEQNIVQFDSASAPFDLILLIDLSGSTRDVVALIRAAAQRFVDAARPSDRIGIITFAGQARLVSPVTLDRVRLRRSIAAIGTESGDTKLYDAADYAMRHMRSDRGNSRRTAIVLMSDGLDGTVPGVSGQVGSRMSYQELLRQIQEFDGVLYSLWLNTYYEAMHPSDTTAEAFDLAEERMKELANKGGGTYYQVDRLQDLAGAYERVVADLGTVYSLSYRPSNKTRDGSWRAIRVNVNRPQAVARGKHGYYAN